MEEQSDTKTSMVPDIPALQVLATVPVSSSSPGRVMIAGACTRSEEIQRSQKSTPVQFSPRHSVVSSISGKVQELQQIREQIAARLSLEEASPNKRTLAASNASPGGAAVAELEKKVQELSLKVDQLNQRNARERGELMALYENSREEYRVKEKLLNERIGFLDNGNFALRKQVTQLQEEKNALQEEIEQLKKTIFEYDKKISMIYQDNQKMLQGNNSRIDQAEQAKSAIDLQIHRYQCQLSDIIRLDESQQEKLRHCEEQIASQSESLTRLREENLQLLFDKQQLQSENNSLRVQIEAGSDVLTNYKQRSTELVEKVRGYEEQVKQLFERIENNKDYYDEHKKGMEILILDKQRLLEEKGVLLQRVEERSAENEQLKRQLFASATANAPSKSQEQDERQEYRRQMQGLTDKMTQVLEKLLDYEKKLLLMDKERVDAIEEKDFWMNKCIKLQEEQERQQGLAQTFAAPVKQTKRTKKAKNSLSGAEEVAAAATSVTAPSPKGRDTNQVQFKSVLASLQATPAAIATETPAVPVLVPNIKEQLIKKQLKSEGTIFAKPKACNNCGIIVRKNQKYIVCNQCQDPCHDRCLSAEYQADTSRALCKKCDNVTHKSTQNEDIE